MAHSPPPFWHDYVIGGIATVDDAMQFLVTGASAIQVGTANYYDPTASMKIAEALPAALAEAGVCRVADIVGVLQTSTESTRFESLSST